MTNLLEEGEGGGLGKVKKGKKEGMKEALNQKKKKDFFSSL